MIYKVFSILVALLNLMAVQSEDRIEKLTSVHRSKRYFTYVSGSAMGIFVAFAVPLELPNQDVVFSYNYEANYNLPWDGKQFNLVPPEDERSLINRTSAYSFIKTRLSSFGLNGHECLLKLICQVAKTPVEHNGLVGHLVQALFTPSSSRSEDLKEEEDAEKLGKSADGNCQEKFTECNENLLDKVSHIS